MRNKREGHKSRRWEEKGKIELDDMNQHQNDRERKRERGEGRGNGICNI